MAMSVWLTLSLAALAEGAPVAAPATLATPREQSAEHASSGQLEALGLARELAELGQQDSARATLRWLLEQDMDPGLRAEAEALQATLPWRRRDAMPAMRLAAWQTALGAYLLGPHMARISYDPLRTATPYFVGAAGGAVLGTGSALMMATGPGLSQGQANTVIASQQLGGWNGAAIAYLVGDDPVSTSIGLLAGVGVGTAGGYLLTMADPTGGEALGAHSGAVWGLALGAASGGVMELYDDKLLASMLVWSDLGTVAGLALAHRMDLSRSQVWAMNLGGVIGGVGTLQLIALLAASSGVDDKGLIVTGTTGTLLGGGVGLWLATRSDRADRDVGLATAVISGTGDDVRIGLPIPTPIHSDDGLAYGLPLVAYRF